MENRIKIPWGDDSEKDAGVGVGGGSEEGEKIAAPFINEPLLNFLK